MKLFAFSRAEIDFVSRLINAVGQKLEYHEKRSLETRL